jgi:hypothetical protein
MFSEMMVVYKALCLRCMYQKLRHPGTLGFKKNHLPKYLEPSS